MPYTLFPKQPGIIFPSIGVISQSGGSAIRISTSPALIVGRKREKERGRKVEVKWNEQMTGRRANFFPAAVDSRSRFVNIARFAEDFGIFFSADRFSVPEFRVGRRRRNLHDRHRRRTIRISTSSLFAKWWNPLAMISRYYTAINSNSRQDVW